jgi:rhamnose utilization protein RhaD (predicted bifunctional aldolase and dehydrogenase)
MKINHNSISQFCAELGQDRLLVQGAGGNVSWKDGDTLWIKGSGTWLANAKVMDIFVPVDLKKISSSLSKGDFSVTPELITTSDLRPSIETILHALMPQKIVIHLHAINPLAFLVLRDAKSQIEKISKALPWQSVFIEYFKPGVELAQAVCIAMEMQGEINVLFLQNHGVVIGGDSILEVRSILEAVLKACHIMQAPELVKVATKLPKVPVEAGKMYGAIKDIDVQQLAQNSILFNHLHSDWVLYPDHVVFLGSKAFVYESWKYFFSHDNLSQACPDLIFIENEGVFARNNFSLAKIIQLRCYYDVISRVLNEGELNPLNELEIAKLLNWDAEKLRQKMSV